MSDEARYPVSGYERLKPAIFALQDYAQRTNSLLPGARLTPIIRTVLLAMREPGAETLNAGWEQGDWDRVGESDVLAAWQAMIDHLLNESAA